MPTVAVADLERLTTDLFVAHRVPRDDAAWIAALLARANLRGHDSHGAIRIPQYCAAIKAGHLNPTPALRVVTDTPTLAIVDGDQGFGQVVARRGVALAVDKARAHGLAAVALRRRATSAGSPTTRSWRRARDSSRSCGPTPSTG
jgi:LDH2 family malate/lactate/ureidoglycolate dehydrogenase